MEIHKAESNSSVKDLFKRKEIEDDALIDYFKVKTIRLMGMVPAFFYLYLSYEKLKDILDLKVLKTITEYAEYHKKRKKLSYHIDSFSGI